MSARPVSLVPTAALLAALLAAAALPLRAQTPDSLSAAGARAGTLEARMNELLESLYDIERRAADFFPRDGHFTWVHTTHYPSGPRVGFWRFRTADVAKAMETCGPLSGSLGFHPHGQPVGGFYQQVIESERIWKRVRGNRIVLQGGWATTPAFVEWRREGGRWVVSSFGDESHRRAPGRPLLGAPAGGMVVRDTSAAHSRADVYATGPRWEESNLPEITFEHFRYTRYGTPRGGSISCRSGAATSSGSRGSAPCASTPRAATTSAKSSTFPRARACTSRSSPRVPRRAGDDGLIRVPSSPERRHATTVTRAIRDPARAREHARYHDGKPFGLVVARIGSPRVNAGIAVWALHAHC